MRTKLTLLLTLLTLSASADITNVFTGTVAGDHTGDTAYTAFRKINTNFYSLAPTNGVVVGSEARHLNRGALRNVYSRLSQKLPLRILWLGDSIAEELRAATENSLLDWMPRNGSVWGSGGAYFYSTTNGAGTYVAYGVNDGIWPSSHYNMAAASQLTWASTASNGVTANMVEAYYWVNNGFTTLNIQTQAFGGSWATALSVPCNNGGALTPAFTNFYLGTVIPNCQVRFTTSGTNMVFGFGLWNTNAYAGYRSSIFYAPGCELTAYPSNALHVFLAGMQPDLLIVSAKEATAATYSNGVWFLEEVLSKVSTNTAVVHVAANGGVGNNANFALLKDQRDMSEQLSRAYNRAMFDEFGLLLPTNALSPLFNDESHLNSTGQSVVGSKFSEWLGFPQILPPLGFTNYRYAPQDLTPYAKLDPGTSGQLFTNLQKFSSIVIVSNNFQVRGPSAQFQIWRPSDDQVLRFVRDSDSTLLKLKDSASSEASMLSLSNNIGRVSLDLDSPYSMNVGTAGRWNFYFGSNQPPTGPSTPGNAYLWNSNGVVYLLTSGNGTSWTATNKIAP